MPRLRRLSGDDVASILSDFDFILHSHRGSHMKLRRVLEDGTRQSLTVPRHRELAPGTLRAIYRQALRYLPESELRARFFAD